MSFDFQPDFFGESKPPANLSWREKYEAVIRSKRWRLLRRRLIEKNDKTCPRCGWRDLGLDKNRTLDLHHKTYERLGHEKEDDLELLCSVCHVKADRDRAKRGKKKSLGALRRAQFEGWARRKYGDEFGYIEDESMHNDFDDWMAGGY